MNSLQFLSTCFLQFSDLREYSSVTKQFFSVLETFSTTSHFHYNLILFCFDFVIRRWSLLGWVRSRHNHFYSFFLGGCFSSPSSETHEHESQLFFLYIFWLKTSLETRKHLLFILGDVRAHCKVIKSFHVLRMSDCPTEISPIIRGYHHICVISFYAMIGSWPTLQR